MSGAISGATIAMLAIAGGTAAASIGLGVYEAVNQPSAPAAPTQEQTNQQTAQASQAAALAQATALTRRRGMASTILQSPMTSGNAIVGKATLGA